MSGGAAQSGESPDTAGNPDQPPNGRNLGEPPKDQEAGEPPAGNPKTRPFRMAMTLALGAGGGWLFYQLAMPLPWMIGALVVTTALSLAGAPLVRPKRLRLFMVPVLGVLLGASFTPDVVDQTAKWLVSLTALIVYVLLVTACVAYYLARVAGWDPPTAYFSASPGGFGEMALLGEAMGADDRKISLNHSVRILITVMVIPFWFKLFEGYEPGNMAALGDVAHISIKDAAILVGCAVVGFWLGRRLNFPAAQLLGPTLVSAIVHMADLTKAHPPQEIVAIAQVVIGAAIGCRFIGISLTQVFGVMLRASGITVFMLSTALAFAWVLAPITGLPVTTLWLTFAPGGLAEMTLISLSLGIDVAFVSVHHMVRVIFLVSIAAIAFKLLNRVLEKRAKGG